MKRSARSVARCLVVGALLTGITKRIGGVAIVVGMDPQPVEPAAVRTLRGPTHLPVVLLADVLLHRELHPHDLLHPTTIQWRERNKAA